MAHGVHSFSPGFCTPPACPAWATFAGTPGGAGDTPSPVGLVCRGAQSTMRWGGKRTWGAGGICPRFWEDIPGKQCSDPELG